MSEQASLFQSSILLLGEYCPISRKKSTRRSLRPGSLKAYNNTNSSGFQFSQPIQFHCLF
ncbi:hypothetical protein N665_0131s0022 [Sinapis alba]|nr:hypothetical protein N665_0131s0022 [Sinapis alba]